MRLREILKEAMTDISYHYTNTSSAAEILKDKRFRLSSSFGTDSERSTSNKKHKWYFLSVARTKTADYTLHNTYKFGVVFNLNGRWFNNKYETKPVDYWERFWLKARLAGAKDRYSEMEDRLVSTNPYIDMKNPKDAILEIHLLVDPNDYHDNDHRSVRDILKYSLLYKIPIFVYYEKDNFILQNKNKSIPLEEVIKTLKPKVKEPSTRMATDWLERYRELYYKNDTKSLSPEAKRAKRLLRSMDAVTSINADLHNMKSKDVELVKKFLDIMKKENWNSVSEYVDAMREKWDKIDEKEY